MIKSMHNVSADDVDIELQNFISIKEFRELGYLQEVNRQFFHPLGLALEVRVDEDGNESLNGIRDGRDDPEGIIFADEHVDSVKLQGIRNIWKERGVVRYKTFGYMIQPSPSRKLRMTFNGKEII